MSQRARVSSLISRPDRPRFFAYVLCSLFLLACVPASLAQSTIADPGEPFAVAVNSVTNKIYVTHQLTSSVMVIDGSSNSTTSVPVGAPSQGLAVNPVTNKIYVATISGVVVIDGATNGTTSLGGPLARSVAVNTVTNKIYVTNSSAGTVTVIDGATNSTATVPAGTGTFTVAVNTTTNKIYVVNRTSGNVTVIDGATNGTSTISVGTFPYGVAVNEQTNKIYVTDENSSDVSVIDGASNTVTATIPTGRFPAGVAVNATTNKIYVANFSTDNTVTVIDGATNGATNVTVGSQPMQLAVNPLTNQIYVGNYAGSTVSVIDGSTNSTTTVNAAAGPQSLAVNTSTNRVYVADFIGLSITVINGGATGAPQTGWWWDPNLSGIGFFIEYGGVSGNGIFMAGFLYDASGNNTWLVSTGPLSGSTYSGNWLKVTGGQTLLGPYTAPNPATNAGSVTINFTSPTTAVLTRPDNSQVNIQRFSFTTQPIPPPQAGTPQVGWWWGGSAASGTGYGIEFQGNSVFIVAYVYDNAGNPVWYLATGTLTSPTTYSGTWDVYAGGPQLTSPEGSPGAHFVSSATPMTLTFGDATHGTLTMGSSVAFPIVRFQLF